MLNDKQLKAIDLMVAGVKYSDIEKEVGVSHTQFWRWRNAEPEFSSALEQLRIATHRRRADKLWSVADRAMDVALDALDEGDPVMARDILKMTVGGLTDIEYVSRDESDSAGPALEESAVYICNRCGKECRSAAGLASHSRTHAA